MILLMLQGLNKQLLANTAECALVPHSPVQTLSQQQSNPRPASATGPHRLAGGAVAFSDLREFQATPTQAAQGSLTTQAGAAAASGSREVPVSRAQDSITVDTTSELLRTGEKTN